MVASERAWAGGDVSASLGVVMRHGDELCAYLAAAPPALEKRLGVVVPGRLQTVAAASLDGGDTTCHDEITPHMEAFRLHLRSGTIPPRVAAIGIVGDANLSQAGQAFEWHLQSAQPVTFSSCTSADGVHLSAWQQGRRVWHAYVYVGQDLVPDCTQSQAQP
jgi:hypothetical protein